MNNPRKEFRKRMNRSMSPGDVDRLWPQLGIRGITVSGDNLVVQSARIPDITIVNGNPDIVWVPAN